MDALTTTLTVLDYAAVAVFGASGALAAARRKHDIVTFSFFAAVTGVGGGTLRDLLIDAPVFWVGRPQYIGLCIVGAVAIWIFGRGQGRERLLLWLDAVGMAAYTVVGTLKAVSLDSSLAETRCALAMTALVYDFDLPTAKREFGIALGINPGYADAHLYRGLTLLALGRPAAAVDNLCRAAAVYSTTPGVLGLLATAYARSGQIDKAQHAAREALACDPSCGEATDALAVVSLQTGHTADAARLLAAGDLLERAALLLDCGEAHETIQLLGGSPGAQVGSSIERDVLLGRAYEQTGEIERARMHYESATIKDEHWWPARLALARTWSQAGEWREALKAIGRDLEAVSESPEVLVLAGDCHRHLGRAEQAVACYSQALNIFAGYVPALVGRALAQRLRGDETAAQSDLHAALRHDPMNVLARRLLEIGAMSSADELRRSLLGNAQGTTLGRAA